jgi:hypothetical protein
VLLISLETLSSKAVIGILGEGAKGTSLCFYPKDLFMISVQKGGLIRNKKRAVILRWYRKVTALFYIEKHRIPLK